MTHRHSCHSSDVLPKKGLSSAAFNLSKTQSDDFPSHFQANATKMSIFKMLGPFL